MIEVSIEVETGKGFERLQKLLDDLTPFYRDISRQLQTASDRAFREQADPVTGAAWKPLSPVTVKRRGSDSPILIVNNSLNTGTQAGYSAHGAWISSSEKYAPTHYFGAKQGAFGRTKRGAPIPWGDIPARPFMGLGPEEEDEIMVMIKSRLNSAAKG